MKAGKILKTLSISTVLIAILLALFFNASAQTKSHVLYMGMNDIGPKTKSFLAANNIPSVAIFDNRYIDPTNALIVDTAILAKAIIARFPVQSATGIAVLDWEGKLYDDLHLATMAPTPAYQFAMKKFIEAIKFAKSMRPNVKWGFYGLPFASHYTFDQQWIMSNTNIKPLLMQCDVFFPSFYVNGYETGGDDNFTKNNLNQILALAKNTHKFVLPFVWHRYHESARVKSMQLIPLNEFTDFIGNILSTSYNGKTVDGIIWWGADNYYYQVKTPALLKEYTGNNFPSYHDSLMVNYGTEILKTVKSH